MSVRAICPGSISVKTATETTLQIVFYRRITDPDCLWRDESDWSAVDAQLSNLTEEYKGLNIILQRHAEPSEIIIRGYGDVLNSIRLRFPKGGFANTCLGHVIGSSAKRILADDLKRGINRILFAPETIEPQGSDKVVCHNCGCGC